MRSLLTGQMSIGLLDGVSRKDGIGEPARYPYSLPREKLIALSHQLHMIRFKFIYRMSQDQR